MRTYADILRLEALLSWFEGLLELEMVRRD